MFVTAEDFNIDPYVLPNIDADEDFTSYVNREERLILVKILGRLLYDEFIDALFTVENGNYTAKAEEDIDQRWKDLRDGADYVMEDKPYHYEGIRELLKPYIYSQHTKHKARLNTGIGVTVANSENSMKVDPIVEIVRGWNDFSDRVGDECHLCDTLYGFLYNSGETYLDVFSEYYGQVHEYLCDKFGAPGRMNRLGI